MYNILIVDDNATNLLLLEAIITCNFEHNVYQAQSAKEAMLIVLREPIDIILSDIQMPLVSGYGLLRELKSKNETKDIPVVLVSAIDKSDENQIEAYESGAIGFISKPINNKLLVSKLKSYLKIVESYRELKNRNIFVDSLLEASNEAMIVCDDSLRVLEFNSLAKTFFEPLEEFIKLDTMLGGALGRDIKELKRTSVCLNKTYRYKNLSLAVHSSALGDERTIFFFHDVTASQKETRFSSMGEMIHMIAHQWRQPLATLASVSLKIKAKKMLKVLSDENIDESLEKIQNIVEYLNKTIDDFMTFFNDNERKKHIFLGTLLLNPQKLLESYIAKSKCTINIEYRDSLSEFSELFLLESKLNQVLLNIIKNSIDEFINKDIQNPLINIECGVDDKDFCIEIFDNGGGIELGMIDNIFEPYFSTKDKNGSGIGLYMSKLIVTKLFHGSINAKNTEDGMSFKILIPKEVLEKNI